MTRSAGEALRFAALVAGVAAVSWLVAAGVARTVRDTGPSSGAVAEGPTAPPAGGSAGVRAAAGLPEGPFAAFWLHPECVACFHYLRSMLAEARSQREDGVDVVFVVFGTEEGAKPLTRFIPDSFAVVHDSVGDHFRAAGIDVTPQFVLYDEAGGTTRHGRGPTAWGRRSLDPGAPHPAVTETEIR